MIPFINVLEMAKLQKWRTRCQWPGGRNDEQGKVGMTIQE